MMKIEARIIRPGKDLGKDVIIIDFVHASNYETYAICIFSDGTVSEVNTEHLKIIDQNYIPKHS